MDRERALKELQARLTNDKFIRHSLAVEAIMRDLAALLRDNVELWGMTGLLHDIDYERTAGDPSKHSIIGAEILENLDFDPEIVYAVKAHNDLHGIGRKRKLDKALYCSDPASWMIEACAEGLSSKQLSDVTADFVLNNMNDSSFAAELDRGRINTCIDLGITLEEFIALSLDAMKKVLDQRT
ncbi:MAG TPA: HDIG domain-containing protein [Clostridia bacterium]|nr:HDIG domain-containing protein [Clostridia bacterium]